MFNEKATRGNFEWKETILVNANSDVREAIAGGQNFRYPRVLIIAGSDSGGGAGIQADLKTCSAFGCYGMTAITALTAQNTRGVHAIHAVPPEFLSSQIDVVVDDIGVDAVKIGMLHNPDVVLAVVDALRRHGWRKVVLDPVMVAASGDPLITTETVEVLVRELFPLVSVITPNLDEAALLVGHTISDHAALEAALAGLISLGPKAVLLKGGHLPGEQVVDLLMQNGRPVRRMVFDRIHTRNMHGTGCSLSSAIACELAMGKSLEDAVNSARTYVHQALAAGADVRLGGGHGPINHGYAPQAMHKLALSGASD